MQRLHEFLKFVGLVFVIPFLTCLTWHSGNGIIAFLVFCTLTVAAGFVGAVNVKAAWAWNMVLGAVGMALIALTLNRSRASTIVTAGIVVYVALGTLYMIEVVSYASRPRFD